MQWGTFSLNHSFWLKHLIRKFGGFWSPLCVFFINNKSQKNKNEKPSQINIKNKEEVRKVLWSSEIWLENWIFTFTEFYFLWHSCILFYLNFDTAECWNMYLWKGCWKYFAALNNIKQIKSKFKKSLFSVV